jgi:hypothetical protein
LPASQKDPLYYSVSAISLSTVPNLKPAGEAHPAAVVTLLFMVLRWCIFLEKKDNSHCVLSAVREGVSAMANWFCW